MKPDWKDAPEWAKWLALDIDGIWRWFENKPQLNRFGWECNAGECEDAPNKPNKPWNESLEPRP